MNISEAKLHLEHWLTNKMGCKSDWIFYVITNSYVKASIATQITRG